MTDLSVKYLGLTLRNPVIVASSGLTNSVEKIKELENAGAGAVVLKSLFEEQILAESSHNIGKDQTYGNDVFDYVSGYIRENSVNEYLKLIKEAKASVSIPVIASINCVDNNAWTDWAKKTEEAGADALEINMSVLPSDSEKTSGEIEDEIFKIIENLRKAVNIPVALKISYYSASLANFIKKISWTRNVDGIVLFNRFYNPDIDIEKFKITSANVFSGEESYTNSLRWISILCNVVDEKVDLAATTGIHSGETVIKQLLAGAKAVQIASAIYKNGPEVITSFLRTVEDWMERHGYETIEEFRGKMAFKADENTVAFERIQFMKHFGGIE
jgi:dihydroorotate dehydrogenase (fumarate)